MRMRHKDGDILFREGDPSDFACLILEGGVEVSRRGGDGGDKVVLGSSGVGDLVGEMGVIENQPRSATVTAVGDVLVEIIAADAFIDWVCAVPERAHHLLTRLSGKVRLLSNELVQLAAAARDGDTGAGDTDSPPTATEPASFPMMGFNLMQGFKLTESGLDDTFVGPGAVRPGTRPGRNPGAAPSDAPLTLQARIAGTDGTVETVEVEEQPNLTLSCRHVGAAATVLVARLPYRVGRQAPEMGLTLGDAGTLLVPDPFPHRMSPSHFQIDRDPKLGIVIRDLGSDLGTTVNGQFLGGIFAKDTCRLQRGPNVVIAGGLDSPFVFEINVG